MIIIRNVYHAVVVDNLPREQRLLQAASPRHEPQAQGRRRQLRHLVTSIGLRFLTSRFLGLDPTSRLPGYYTRVLKSSEIHCLQLQRTVRERLTTVCSWDLTTSPRQPLPSSFANLQVHQWRLKLDTCHRCQRYKEWLGTYLGTSPLCPTNRYRSICSRYAAACCGLSPNWSPCLQHRSLRESGSRGELELCKQHCEDQWTWRYVRTVFGRIPRPIDLLFLRWSRLKILTEAHTCDILRSCELGVQCRRCHRFCAEW